MGAVRPTALALGTWSAVPRYHWLWGIDVLGQAAYAYPYPLAGLL
jgi:hypothetical protein